LANLLGFGPNQNLASPKTFQSPTALHSII